MPYTSSRDGRSGADEVGNLRSSTGRRSMELRITLHLCLQQRTFAAHRVAATRSQRTPLLQRGVRRVRHRGALAHGPVVLGGYQHRLRLVTEALVAARYTRGAQRA